MNDGGRGVQSKAGLANILYYIATAEEALTAREISTDFDVGKSHISTQLTRLYQSGLLLRRQCGDEPSPARREYEYVLAPRKKNE